MGLSGFEDDAHSGNAGFRAPDDRTGDLFDGLKDHGLIVSTRDGYLCTGPHFYNNEQEFAIYLDALKDVLG